MDKILQSNYKLSTISGLDLVTENSKYNRNQTYLMSASSSSSPAVSMIWCGSLASSVTDSVLSNVQIRAAVLITIFSIEVQRLFKYRRLIDYLRYPICDMSLIGLFMN